MFEGHKNKKNNKKKKKNPWTEEVEIKEKGGRMSRSERMLASRTYSSALKFSRELRQMKTERWLKY